MARNGLRRARAGYLTEHFDAHCKAFKIPPGVATIIRDIMTSDYFEVNLFGGNPELHKKIMEIIRALRSAHFRVNLTTTGARFMRDQDFVDDFKRTPSDVLALSADDFEVEKLEQLLDLDLAGLRAEWKGVPSDHGQEKKAIEAIYGAKLLKHQEGLVLLFNMVISRANIRQARQIIDVLEQRLPHVIVNPYPNQEGFHWGGGLFLDEELVIFESLVDWAIELHINGGRFVKRLQYWLLMKSAFNTWRSEPGRIAEAVAGYGIWRCYKGPGAGRYIQIGRGPKGQKSSQTQPGGHLGCFWNNETVTEGTQIQRADQVTNFLQGGNRNISDRSGQPCPGCAMPRLLFDLLTLQSGMDEELIPEFIRLRQQYAEF
jgi:organic radical activating enzyme